MADDRMTGPRRRSIWIRYVEVFLIWVGARAIYNLVLYLIDPNYRAAIGSALLVVLEGLFGALALGAAVSIYLRFRHALMMSTAALALYTGITAAEVFNAPANLPAARAAYKASREARGVPVSEERLDLMFSADSLRMLWVIAALLCIPPYVILLWRKHELEPVDEDDERDA
jgi:hypothetical protein